ncbi:MAG TPA: hypothetical protein PL045_13855, partial [Chitinophagaceae bacterium]|nr:hypothetical protein [Chitinophagaceae bacterium]
NKRAMTIEKLKEKALCCISGMPIRTSDNMNLIQLPYKAAWKFPVWGNVITGQQNMALAVVHDACLTDGKLNGEIKYAIEAKDHEVIYHHVEFLQKLEIIQLPKRACRECGCTENNACYHPELGACWWVEQDLCSHCMIAAGESAPYHQAQIMIDELKSGDMFKLALTSDLVYEVISQHFDERKECFFRRKERTDITGALRHGTIVHQLFLKTKNLL